jgi:hypothetical protein
MCGDAAGAIILAASLASLASQRWHEFSGCTTKWVNLQLTCRKYEEVRQ